jgi:hypothetical protein
MLFAARAKRGPYIVKPAAVDFDRELLVLPPAPAVAAETKRISSRVANL